MEKKENIDIADLMSKEIKEININDNDKFLHIRVGNNEKPASDDMIKDIEKKIIELFEEHNINCVAFVTHHAVEINMIKI